MPISFTLRLETKSQLHKSLSGEYRWATRFNSHVKAWALYGTSINREDGGLYMGGGSLGKSVKARYSSTPQRESVNRTRVVRRFLVFYAWMIVHA